MKNHPSPRLLNVIFHWLDRRGAWVRYVRRPTPSRLRTEWAADWFSVQRRCRGGFMVLVIHWGDRTARCSSRFVWFFDCVKGSFWSTKKWFRGIFGYLQKVDSNNITVSNLAQCSWIWLPRWHDSHNQIPQKATTNCREEHHFLRCGSNANHSLPLLRMCFQSVQQAGFLNLSWPDMVLLDSKTPGNVG